jgi:hypothetical protein
MKVYKNVQALYSASAGSANIPFHSGQALAVRIVPNFSSASFAGVYLPRTILVTDNVKRNNQITLGDSGWFLIDRNFLQIRDDDSDHPFARTIGPRATLSFGIELVGSSLSDNWNVWVAEDLLDLMAGPAPLITLVRDNTSGLFFPTESTSSVGQLVVNIGGQSVATLSTQIFGDGSQIYDSTATASSALNSGTINTLFYADLLIRISGLTPATARGLTVNGVRLDSSVTPIWVPTAIGATITDAIYAMGEGANIPAAPIGATSVGASFAGPVPQSMQFNLSTGTDTPRMTIWGRSTS